jgi:hypothetical protein
VPSKQFYKRTHALRIGEWCILLAAVVPCIFGALLGSTRGSSEAIPINYWFWSAASIVIVWDRFQNPRRGPGFLLLLVGLSAFLFMLLVGIIADNELKWIALDCVCFGGLLIGVIWAIQIEWWDLIAFARRLYLTGAVMAICGLIAGWLGVIATSDASRDLESYSMLWVGISFVILFLPTLYVSGKFVQSRFEQAINSASVLVGLILIFSVPFYLVNRSYMVGAFLSLACLMRIIALNSKSKIARWLFVGALALALIAALMTAGDFEIMATLTESRLFQKVEYGRSSNEPRVDEALAVLLLAKDNPWTGLGFGSEYEVFLTRTGQLWEYIHIPHLGAFAFLLKGGFPIYISFVLAPFLLAAYRFFGPTPKDEVALTLWGQVLLYLTLSSCTTGGWTFFSTFFYGAFFTKALQYRPSDQTNLGRMF